ncbi:MAG TPA: BatD family protein [Vicinamibacteria bacterium]|nr:BatD family protein [Vicinamibacteria bacterium]
MKTVALGLLLVASASSAAAFTLRSEVDARKVGVEDQLQLTLTVEGGDAPDEVPLPALSNLEVVGGPFTSTQVSIVNGRMSQSRSYTYALKPRAVGRAEVGPAKAGDQTAPAIPIEVVAGRLREREPRAADPFGRDPFGQDPFGGLFESGRGRRAPPKLQVQAALSRTQLRVGEPLVLTYSLLTQSSVTDLQFKDAPRFSGFWVEDLEKPDTAPSGEAATVDGESYRRFPVLRKLLFPTKAGTLALPAATFRIRLARQGFFDAVEAVERSTQPLSVTVEPLPEAEGFAGAVGRFRVGASLDRDRVALGEAATLRFRVEGTGNLKWIDRGPEVVVKGARVFPPQGKSELRATAEGVTGSRSWEFVVVPETSGTLSVPALSFSYFDPQAGRIVAAATTPLTLDVVGGPAAAGSAAAAPGAPSRAGSPLALRSALDRPLAASLSARTVSFCTALALVLHAAIWGADRLRRGDESARRAAPRALRAARRELARVGAQAMTKEQAAALVEKALHEAFGDVSDGDSSERARTLRALIDDVRYVRYAPQLGDYTDKLKDLAARADEAVRRWA